MKPATKTHSHEDGSNSANKMKSLSCYICKELTESQKSYRKHLAKIHKKPVYQCQSCTQGFTSRTQLKTHLVSLCRPTTRLHMEVFICDECPMFYSKKSELCSHKQKVHCSNPWLQMVITEDNGFIGSDFASELQVDEYEAKESVNDDAKEMMKSTNPIMCYVCKKVVSSQRSYKKHLVKVHAKSASQNLSCFNDFTKSLLPLNCKSVFKTKLNVKETYTCDECPMIYLNLSSLSNHKQDEHSFGQVSMFDVRNEEEILNTSSDMAKQIIPVNKSDNTGNLENKNSKLCYICKKVMSGQKSYKKHLAKAHEKCVYQCLSCFHGFMSRRLLRLHLESGCRDEINAHKTYACDECPMIYRKKSGLSHHMQEEHGTDTDILFKINVAENRVSAQNVIIQEMSNHKMDCKRTENESILICYVCQDIMDSQKLYKKHLSKVHNKLPYQCPKCSRCCRSKSLLKVHCKFICKSESVTERKYVCDLCPITYGTNRAFLQHKRKEHSNGQDFRKYICKHCSKCLSSAKIKNNHEGHCLGRQTESKSSAKKFCSKCKKSFATDSSLIYHRKTVHDKRVHVCGCGEIFRWASGYYKHLKSCAPLAVK